MEVDLFRVKIRFLDVRKSQERQTSKKFWKILDLKSSSEQIFSENYRWVSLIKRCESFQDFVFGRWWIQHKKKTLGMLSNLAFTNTR